MIASLALVVAAQLGRFAQVELELVGPLERVRVEVVGRTATELDAALVAGETRTVLVPLAVERTQDEVRVTERPECAGSARWIGWVRDGVAQAEQRWNALPLALRSRARPLPPSVPAAGRVPLAALVFVLGWLVAVVGLRRRGALVGALSLLGTLALAATWARPRPARDAVRVIEGDGTEWVAIDVARERASLDPRAPLQLALEPASAPVDGLLARDRSVWTLRAPGAAILRWSEIDPGGRSMTPDRNGWADLRRAWVRDPDGAWRAVGPWSAGAPLPASSAAGDPPGWLNPALPMGLRVVIGELAAGAPGARAETWLRWTGP